MRGTKIDLLAVILPVQFVSDHNVVDKKDRQPDGMKWARKERKKQG